MADINSSSDAPRGTDRRHLAEPRPGASRDEEALYELIELLFFAYRDFISDPDLILSGQDFGRAHHRVLHFINRKPGIRVAELLDILKITKQSLGRVLKQLIERDYVRQRAGHNDRRQRLLYVTERGRALAGALAAPQMARFRTALAGLGDGAEQRLRDALIALIDEAERDKVRRWIAR
jgi:DNA-binding MarR family transcriptional regulator